MESRTLESKAPGTGRNSDIDAPWFVLIGTGDGGAANHDGGDDMLMLDSERDQSPCRGSLERRRRRDVECLVWHVERDTRGVHVHRRANIISPLVLELGICESAAGCPNGNSGCAFYSNPPTCELRRIMAQTRVRLASLPQATVPVGRARLAIAC